MLFRSVLLIQKYPIFEFLPIETLIKKRQKEYYSALSNSDKKGNSTDFIEFMLEIIDDSLEELLQTQPILPNSDDRINIFKTIIKSEFFNRKEYMRHFKDISTATASRDLKKAVEKLILIQTGNGRMTLYKYSENC